MKLRIRYMDGRFSTIPLNANELLSSGPEIHNVRDDVYEAWKAHVRADVAWQDYWLQLDDLRYKRQEIETLVGQIERFRAALDSDDARETFTTRQFLEGLAEDLRRLK